MRQRDGSARSLDELREVIGIVPGLPVVGSRITGAFQEGLITASEAKRLQGHSRLTPRRQREVIAAERPVTDEQLAATKARLDDLRSRLGD